MAGAGAGWLKGRGIYRNPIEFARKMVSLDTSLSLRGESVPRAAAPDTRPVRTACVTRRAASRLKERAV